MRQRVRQAKLKAAEARESALHSTNPVLKDEWLRVSRMWEELVFEYEEVARAREQLAGGA